MNERSIEAFWDAHPCGDEQVGGLHGGSLGGDHAAFFARYDAFRYRTEPHIPRCLDALSVAGERVLEIGLGQGADSEQLIRRGARWSGVDLTREAVRRVGLRLRLHDLPHEQLVQGSACALPFADGSFDTVYSHGVLHHIPNIATAQSEIARVLRPGGRLVAMVYARDSLNYRFSIGVLRRLGLAALVLSGQRPSGIYGAHVDAARRTGLGAYLRMERFIHRNTDGPDNPYSKVYNEAELRRDFPRFTLERTHKEHLHAPPLPLARLPFRRPLSRYLGWHLWAHFRR